jgi:hypothetical protein
MKGALSFRRDLPHIADAYLLSSAIRPKLIDQFNQWLTKNAVEIEQLQRKRGIIE